MSAKNAIPSGGVLIAPGFSVSNRGDQALLREAVELVREARPDCELAVLAERPEAGGSSADAGVRLLPKLLPNPRRALGGEGRDFLDSRISALRMGIRAAADLVVTSLLFLFPRCRPWARLLLGKERFLTYSFLRSARALVVKGGGFVYAYRGLRWSYYLRFSLFTLRLAARCGVPVIVLPNSFGPFESRASRRRARSVLKHCSLLTVREPLSREVLDQLLPGKALLFPDMAFGLKPAPEEWARKELSRLGLASDSRPRVGITLRPWRFPGEKDPRGRYHAYLQSFAALLEHLPAKGIRPVLFAHSSGPHAHEDDRIALGDLMELLPPGSKPFRVEGDYDCRQLQALYHLMDFMVCTRFHSAVFAITGGVPCLAVSYQGHKAPGIMGEIGLENFVLPIEKISPPLLIETFERLLKEEAGARRKMDDYLEGALPRLEELRRLVISELREER